MSEVIWKSGGRGEMVLWVKDGLDEWMTKWMDEDSGWL